jgi:hypothetical protein
MAMTDYYVDPSIAANSGTGTIGDPYGDLQYAINSVTRNTTDGDRFNIKAGTAEVLASTLSFALYGTPNISASVVFQGYTSSQGDGGIGEIDGNGNNISTNSSVSYVDLELHNGDAAGNLVYIGGACIVNCEVHDANNGIVLTNYSSAESVNVYDCDTYGIYLSGNSYAKNCYIRSRSTDSRGAMTTCIQNSGRSGTLTNCILSCDSTTNGIANAHDGCVACNCSILSAGGTGYGIYFGDNAVGAGAWNNLIEGFSGTGGDGIIWHDATPREPKGIVAHNTIFNCASSLTNDNNVVGYKTNNTTASGTLFAKSGSDTFANRIGYFEPNTSNAGTNLSGNGYRGAVAAAAAAAAAGGGGLLRVNLGGGISG